MQAGSGRLPLQFSSVQQEIQREDCETRGPGEVGLLNTRMVCVAAAGLLESMRYGMVEVYGMCNLSVVKLSHA